MHFTAHLVQPEVAGLQLSVDTIKRGLAGGNDLVKACRQWPATSWAGMAFMVGHFAKRLPA
jgi:hypothetical protein